MRMRKLLILASAVLAAAAVVSCGAKGGRTVSVGGRSVDFTAAAGEFSASSLDSAGAPAQASPGEIVTVTFEYAPDAVNVTLYPPDGEPEEIPASKDAYTLTFAVPDTVGVCGVNVGYSVDSLMYNISFRLDISAADGSGV